MPDYNLASDRRPYSWEPGVYVGVPGGIPDRTDTSKYIYAADYGADPTGVADSTSAIAAAISAAASAATSESNYRVVILAAGNFKITSLGISNSYVTLRGAGDGVWGSGTTKLLVDLSGAGSPSDSAGIYLGVDMSSWVNAPWAPEATVTAGLTKGSTSLTATVTSSNNPYAHFAKLSIANDASIPVLGVNSNATRHRYPIFRVTSASTTSGTATIGIFPPLPADYSGVAVTFRQNEPNGSIPYRELSGIEDLWIDGANQMGQGVQWHTSFGFWLKNVKITNQTSKGIRANQLVNCEIRGCTIGTGAGGPGKSGLLIDTGTACLIEDNIFYENQPGLQINLASFGNVIASNFFINGTAGLNITASHLPHNQWNLYEGNITPNIQADDYWGSTSDDTLTRNWFTGFNDHTSSTQTYCISLKRFAHRFNFLGNVYQNPTASPAGYYNLGYPNIGNGSSNGTSQFSAADYPAAWNNSTLAPYAWTGTVTARANDENATITIDSGSRTTFGTHLANCGLGSGGNGYASGATDFQYFVITAYDSGTGVATCTVPQSGQGVFVSNGAAVTLSPSALGWQEIDLDVEETGLFKGNYSFFDSGIAPGEGLSGDTIPVSYYQTAAPDFFGDKSWPAIDPTSPPSAIDSTTLAEMLPAAHRYYLGNTSYLDGTRAAQPTFSPAASSFNVTQSVTISTTTPSASIYYTTDGSTPDNTDTLYTAPVSIAVSTTLKAIAYATGLDPSTVRTGAYVIQAYAPTYSPVAGTYGSAQSVTITSATSGSSIYYTTDGSTPDNTDTLYTGPVSITSTTTLRAIAYKSPLDPSTVTSGAYTISSGAPAMMTVNGTLSAATWAF